jgi:hypothetical protein
MKNNYYRRVLGKDKEEKNKTEIKEVGSDYFIADVYTGNFVKKQVRVESLSALTEKFDKCFK